MSIKLRVVTSWMCWRRVGWVGVWGPVAARGGAVKLIIKWWFAFSNFFRWDSISYPCQWVSQRVSGSVIKSFRFGDSYRISELCYFYFGKTLLVEGREGVKNIYRKNQHRIIVENKLIAMTNLSSLKPWWCCIGVWGLSLYALKLCCVRKICSFFTTPWLSSPTDTMLLRNRLEFSFRGNNRTLTTNKCNQ